MTANKSKTMAVAMKFLAGDTAWAPRCSAGRTAGSAGPRRRNAQLRWAMRWQDPRAVGDKNPSPCPLPQGARDYGAACRPRRPDAIVRRVAAETTTKALLIAVYADPS